MSHLDKHPYTHSLDHPSVKQKLEDEKDLLKEATKEWIWWGKPLWHDLGYLAVSLLSLSKAVSSGMREPSC